MSGAFALIGLPTATPGASLEACPPAGTWIGEIRLRGDRWPVRLHLGSTGEGPAAALDLPELVMVREPIGVRCEADRIVIALPFGLGEVALSAGTGTEDERPGREAGMTGEGAGPTLRGAREVGESDTLVVRLARDAPPPYETRDLRFGTKEQLAGTLYVPAAPGPHPAVVLVHGSGPRGRDDWSYRSWADVWARLGVVALVYDKRGVGGSTGDFRHDSAFVGLTADALAAVRALRRVPGVDPSRVGLSGGSQAGWISIRAASADPGIAFLALRAPPAVRVAEQELQRVEAGVRAAGFDEEAVADAVAHTRLLFHYVATRHGWEALVESSRRVRATGWRDQVHTPEVPQDLRWWRTHWDVDPTPDLRRLRIPVLAFYSLEDPVVPALENAGRMRLLLERAGAEGTVLTLARGDHRLELPAGRDVEGRWRFPRIAPTVLDTLAAWVRSRLGAIPPGAGEPAAGRVRPTPERPGGRASRAPDTSDFIAHLEALASGTLRRTDATGLGIALIRRGEVVWAGGFGTADPATGEPVGPTTLFNVGSIAKTLTAWGVMKLVEEGALDLDASVAKLLPGWPLVARDSTTSDSVGPSSLDGVTVRGLLAHTAGLSMGATPETPPGATPDLAALLADSLRSVAKPGTAWRYSGGGYGLLELLVEARTGRAFADYMRDEILEPLGMTRSFFGWRPELPALAATPMDGGAPTGYRDTPVLAAAGLWTTVDDLARFAAASLGSPGEPRGGGVIRTATVDAMRAPAPGTEQSWGIRYGLGTNLWPTTGGRFAAGHAGQNTGWAAAMWTLPETGDGIVLLTNASDGADGYRWPLCDWVGWAAGASWGAYCADRSDGPRGTLDPLPPRGHASGPRLAPVDSLLAARFGTDGPGVAVGIRHGDAVIHAAGYGAADRATGSPIGTDTPFYLASLTKPWTALLVARLVENGRLSWQDRLRDLLPELPAFADVTVRQLVTHTGGVPDYYRFIDWPRLRRLDDDAVLDTLRAHPEPDFTPGARFSYSNSGYALLAEIVRRVEDRPFAQVFEETFVEPLGLRSTSVGHPPAAPVPRAVGYVVEEGVARVSDWNAIELPSGPVVEYALTTAGAGGAFSSVADLLRLERALAGGELARPGTVAALTSRPVAARGLEGPGGARAYGLGWVVSERDGRRIVWHDGTFAGFSTALLRVPALGLSVVVLSNAGGTGALDLADELLGLLAARMDQLPG